MKGKMILTIAALLATGAAMADSPPRGIRDPHINDRQHHQRQRMVQGVRSGELTRQEARGLMEGQRDIRQLERAYKSDGTLTTAERHDLRHEQRQTSRDIYRQKHDGQKR
jgi:hypothetical protein